MPTFTRTPYKDLFEDLIATKQWLVKIGIKITGTRFERILELCKIIVDATINNTIHDVINKFDNIELWYALTESSAFISIYRSSKHQKSHILKRQKLTEMLNGPFLPWDESTSLDNIHGRNALFELEMASQFSAPGIKIIDYDDVDFVFKKNKFNVQCKRIHSSAQVQANIEKAVSQIIKKSSKGSKGVICLSIDKIVAKEQMILRVSRPEEISPIIGQLTDGFINQYRSLWSSISDDTIIGVIVVLHAVASIEESVYPLLTTCKDTALDILAKPTRTQCSDYSLMKSLGTKLIENL